MRSWAACGFAAALQRALSAPASRTIASQRSAVVLEFGNSFDRAVDLLVAVGQRQEHGFELARGDVDPAGEEMAEECPVPLGVAPLRVVEVANRRVGHEERRHCADPLNAAV